MSVLSVQNRPDSSGWKLALAAVFGSGVEMKGILEMPFKTVQYVRKWKASWRCLPLTDSRPFRSDEAIYRSLQIKIFLIYKI